MRATPSASLVLMLLLAGCAQGEPPTADPPSLTESVDGASTPPRPALASPPAGASESPARVARLTSSPSSLGPVWLGDEGRENPTLVMEAGALVTFEIVILDDAPHGFAVDERRLSPVPMRSATFEAVMPLSGTVAYSCPVHPVTMSGEIRVAPARAPMRLASASEAEPITADVASSTRHEVTAYSQDGRYFFLAAGSDARNPDIAVPANATITVHLSVAQGVHNLALASARSDILTEGESLELTFESGADGVLDYWCDPHKATGMRGRFLVGAYDPYPGRFVVGVDASDLPATTDIRAGDVLSWGNLGDEPLQLAIETAEGKIERELGPGESWEVVAEGEGILHVSVAMGHLRMFGHARVT